MNAHVTQPPVFSTPDKTTYLPVEMSIAKDTIPTKGEQKVHHFAHKTINFWVNYGISLLITDFFLGHTEKDGNKVTSMIAQASGSKAVQNASDWVRDKTDAGRNGIKIGLQKAGMSERVSDTVSNTAVDIFTLMMGGHITASLATYILNRSDKWAKKFDEADDKKRGYTPTPEELAAREARYEYLRNQPKKTAWTVIKSRIIGFALNTGVLGWVTSKMDLRTYYMDKDELAGKRVGIRSFTQGMANTITTFADKKMGVSEKTKNRINYWAELVPFEGLCTLNTSLALSWVSGDDKKKEDPAQHAASSTSSSGVHSVRYTVTPTQSTAVEEDKATSTQEAKWSEGKTSGRTEIKPREEIQPAEIRNQNAGQPAVYA